MLGIITIQIIVPGLYLATNLADEPLSVKTTIREAPTSVAVFTAEDATDSAGVMLPLIFNTADRMAAN